MEELVINGIKSGLVYGKLTVISYDGVVQVGNKDFRYWLCKCDCGKNVSIREYNLKSGNSKSCGCSRKIHLESKTNLYHIWVGMIGRCNNPSYPNYKNYGGRGIKVCDRWILPKGAGYINFKQDMINYAEGLSIDRVDNDGDYCPENCKWSTPTEQGRNRRKMSNNKTGVTGVRLSDCRGCKSYSATYVDFLTGKLKTKSFAIKKYGEEEAFKLACEWRELKIKEQNELGAGYSEGHGK